MKTNKILLLILLVLLMEVETIKAQQINDCSISPKVNETKIREPLSLWGRIDQYRAREDRERRPLTVFLLDEIELIGIFENKSGRTVVLKAWTLKPQLTYNAKVGDKLFDSKILQINAQNMVVEKYITFLSGETSDCTTIIGLDSSNRGKKMVQSVLHDPK